MSRAHVHYLRNSSSTDPFSSPSALSRATVEFWANFCMCSQLTRCNANTLLWSIGVISVFQLVLHLYNNVRNKQVKARIFLGRLEFVYFESDQMWILEKIKIIKKLFSVKPEVACCVCSHCSAFWVNMEKWRKGRLDLSHILIFILLGPCRIKVISFTEIPLLLHFGWKLKKHKTSLPPDVSGRRPNNPWSDVLNASFHAGRASWGKGPSIWHWLLNNLNKSIFHFYSFI